MNVRRIASGGRSADDYALRAVLGGAAVRAGYPAFARKAQDDAGDERAAIMEALTSIHAYAASVGVDVRSLPHIAWRTARAGR